MDVMEKLAEVLKKCGVCNTYAVVQLANALAENGVTIQEWISVKDRLPEVGDDVIVAVFDGYAAYTSIDFIMNDGKWCCNTGNQKVTHWQPMPQPPKGE